MDVTENLARSHISGAASLRPRPSRLLAEPHVSVPTVRPHYVAAERR